MIDPSKDRQTIWLVVKLYACAPRVSLGDQTYYTAMEPDSWVSPFFIEDSVTMPTVATIHYGQAPTPFGPGLIGWNAQGIVMLHLLQADDPDAGEILAQQYPGCSLQRADAHARELLEQAFLQEPSGKSAAKLKLVLSGSPFQLKVWRGLQEIPLGHVRTYGELAEALGHPGAARAVGTALAANQLAYVVPCHRVIRASGESGQYRWGAERKAQMLAWETRQLAESNAAR
jgi:AraC family transcriptional regulator of adaptative response/methylated-DNA-[protein]-cysteine methyltransferase